MKRIFCSQLATYARYHRHPGNCLTHYVGIPLLFLAAILPLEILRFPVAHIEMPLGVALTAPAILGWMALDLGVGATLLVLLCPLFMVAELIVRLGLVWWATAALFTIGWLFQFVGHAVFERRRPAFVDDLSQTFIGPAFVAAKLLVWLGLRNDLAPFLSGPGLSTEQDLGSAQRT
jgi:uncharacterized membrane protein YGL010W